MGLPHGFLPGRGGRQLCRRGSRGGEAFRRGSRRRLGNRSGGTSRRGAEHGCPRLPEGSHRRLVDPPGVARSRRPARPCCPSIHERPFVAGFQRTPGFPAQKGGLAVSLNIPDSRRAAVKGGILTAGEGFMLEVTGDDAHGGKGISPYFNAFFDQDMYPAPRRPDGIRLPSGR